MLYAFVFYNKLYSAFKQFKLTEAEQESGIKMKSALFA